MSRLDELIRELCPNGVEYKKIKDTVGVNRGRRLTKSQLSDDAQYEVYHGSKDSILGRYLDYNAPANTTIVVNTGGIGGVKFLDKPFWCSDGSFWLGHSKEIVDKYLFYCLAGKEEYFASQRRVGGVPTIDRSVVEDYAIPVPPLPVQSEIVRILDSFTELTAELTAELTVRKKQYEYYRDGLLTNAKAANETTMGEVLTFLNGRAYKQEELHSEGKYPVLRVGNFYTNDSWYYSDLELEADKYCEKGDLLYSWAATLGPKIWDGEKCIFHYHIWKILFDDSKIDKQYLYYYLQYDLSQISKSTTKSTMIHVSMGSMKERPIILPDIVEQKRIASLISRFDSICNDIKSGLPAEIEARKKQYEYYRDKLLMFKELGA